MKKLIILSLLSFVSCKKDDTTPIIIEEEPKEQTPSYQNGGVLPSWTQTTNNGLVGTNWVLYKIVDGYSTTNISDTLHFVSNNQYYINSNINNKVKYLLYNSQNSVTLTFQPLISKNNVQCSTNELGFGFETNELINGVKFTNQYNNSVSFRLWLKKI